MPELDDHQLLAEFVRSESETAFAELVRRYAGLVYSTALRFSSSPHHAQEITQAVFIILARKAATLSSRVVLSGWLYQAAAGTGGLHAIHAGPTRIASLGTDRAAAG
jgi:DNA-directed RNA polymerase specialized sigma24 family protein